MSYLKEMLAACSTAVALYAMFSGFNHNLITAIIGFWGVLIGSEIQKATAKTAEKTQ